MDTAVISGEKGALAGSRASYGAYLREWASARVQRGNAAGFPPSTVTTQPVVARACAR